ncbi:VOC family protein [Streptomyces sp. NPDC052101]|uniref:VOC family protein n=1 Tax=Streptomyces sp. NPDC052101 TaxID=3155763 RepID=UPI00342C8957
MPIHRLNHAVLCVSDLARSTAFHHDVLGLRPLPGGFPGAVFLQAARRSGAVRRRRRPRRSPP